MTVATPIKDFDILSTSYTTTQPPSSSPTAIDVMPRAIATFTTQDGVRDERVPSVTMNPDDVTQVTSSYLTQLQNTSAVGVAHFSNPPVVSDDQTTSNELVWTTETPDVEMTSSSMLSYWNVKNTTTTTEMPIMWNNTRTVNILNTSESPQFNTTGAVQKTSFNLTTALPVNSDTPLAERLHFMSTTSNKDGIFSDPIPLDTSTAIVSNMAMSSTTPVVDTANNTNAITFEEVESNATETGNSVSLMQAITISMPTRKHRQSTTTSPVSRRRKLLPVNAADMKLDSEEDVRRLEIDRPSHEALRSVHIDSNSSSSSSSSLQSPVARPSRPSSTSPIAAAAAAAPGTSLLREELATVGAAVVGVVLFWTLLGLATCVGVRAVRNSRRKRRANGGSRGGGSGGNGLGRYGVSIDDSTALQSAMMDAMIRAELARFFYILYYLITLLGLSFFGAAAAVGVFCIENRMIDEVL